MFAVANVAIAALFLAQCTASDASMIQNGAGRVRQPGRGILAARRGEELMALPIVTLLGINQRAQSSKLRMTTMGLFSKDVKTMDDLFVHTLRDVYYAENQIVKALPEMVDKAVNIELKQGFQTHLEETKNHVRRLEQIFQLTGHKAKAVDCPAIDGILEEAEDTISEVDDKDVLDAAMIAAAQAVEHYEIARYGALIAWAKQLGRTDCASILEQTLLEEKAADKKLTGLAEGKVNALAAAS
jgi:ferritin-like metal-binding protein YciE